MAQFGHARQIMPSDNLRICIDLHDPHDRNGATPITWGCNGQQSQLWYWDGDTHQIRWAVDSNKCLASSKTNHDSVILVDCSYDGNGNALPEQAWVYQHSGAIYQHKGPKCMGVERGYTSEFYWGLHMMNCDNSQGRIFEWCSVEDCPPPIPPSVGVFPDDHCKYDASTDAVSWPRFDTEQDLKNNKEWKAYFEAIYGGIPAFGYPICTGAFQFLWKLAAQKAGVVGEPAHCVAGHPGGQDLPDGWYYVGSGIAEATTVFSYISNHHLAGAVVPSGHWVEVSHTSFGGDVGATWFYMSVGSGVWYNVKQSAVFREHNRAVWAVLGVHCSDNPNDKAGNAPTECEKNFPGLYDAVRNLGYESMQFTHHYDCTCGSHGQSSFPDHSRLCPTEIVDLQDLDGASKSCVHFKGGWEASTSCHCKESVRSDSRMGHKVSFSNCGAF